MRADHEEGKLHVDAMHEGLHKCINELDSRVNNFINIVIAIQDGVGDDRSTSKQHANSAASMLQVDDIRKVERRSTLKLFPMQTTLLTKTSTTIVKHSSEPSAPSFNEFLQGNWRG